jgi:hypothetical protein
MRKSSVVKPINQRRKDMKLKLHKTIIAIGLSVFPRMRVYLRRLLPGIVPICVLAIITLLVDAAAAHAFTAPVAGDPFYPAYNFMKNTVIGGALGTTIAIGGVGYGVYQFVKHPELGLLGTIGAGGAVACLAQLPNIVVGLGMII